MFRQSCRVDGAHSGGIWSLAWRGDKILTGGIDGSCKLWSVTKKDDSSLALKSTAATPAQNYGVTSIVTSSDGEFGVSCSQDAIIRFFNLSDMAETGTIEAGLLEAWTVCMSPGDDMLVTGNHAGAVHFISVAEKSKVSTLETQGKLIMSSAFGSDGMKIATSGIDGIVNVIDVENQSVIHKIEAHCLPIRKVAFSADGNLIFTASDDRHVSVFDTKTGLAINSFSHSGMALSLDLSPDRRHFAVGCSDHVVAYWDLGMQRCIHKFDSPHTDLIWSVAFDESGKKFASAGDDGIVQIFESS